MNNSARNRIKQAIAAAFRLLFRRLFLAGFLPVIFSPVFLCDGVFSYFINR